MKIDHVTDIELAFINLAFKLGGIQSRIIIMFGKIAQMFKSNKTSEQQNFMHEHAMQIDPEQGFIIDGMVLNDLSERLEYFSNRSLKNFDDLQALFYKSILINEKIDLEIASQRFVQRLGNTEENLQQFKKYIAILNEYYRQFVREK